MIQTERENMPLRVLLTLLTRDKPGLSLLLFLLVPLVMVLSHLTRSGMFPVVLLNLLVLKADFLSVKNLISIKVF